MARQENLPFDRGEYQSDDSTQLVTTSQMNQLLGRRYIVEDIDYYNSGGVGAKPLRSGKFVTLCLVKNGNSAAAMLPKHVVKFDTTAGNYGSVVKFDGSVAAEDVAGVVDEFLPSSGVPAGSYFYIVVEGPSSVITPDAGAAFNGDIAVGSLLVAATAASSTGTTSGRVGVANITASTQTADYSSIQNPIINAIGRALSAATTGNTATTILCDVARL